MKPIDYLKAARVPHWQQPRAFGPWELERIMHVPYPDAAPCFGWVGSNTLTVLRHHTAATLHLGEHSGAVVMEDSTRELSRHLPIWMVGRGRVLISGLGLGCVVRGLLLKDAVEHIDVVEIDPLIIREIGREFTHDPRVTVHEGNALTYPWPKGERWDYAWHDVWLEEGDGVPLHRLHHSLFHRYMHRVGEQGAWAWPSYLTRLMTWRPLGVSKRIPIKAAA
jgi:hypothetical protein